MSSQRPVYIPRKRKAPRNITDPPSSTRDRDSYHSRRQLQKQQQPRFHGAFTGGFSAGYFNTVGTKEGWKPSQTKKKDQRLEDFMDEEDRAIWGGPTRLRDEYGSKGMGPDKSSTESTTELPASNDSRAPFLPVKSMLEISHQTVGPRLLRRLGWREGGSAIVPENGTKNSTTFLGKEQKHKDDNTLENLAKVHLSSRKLRKIQLQSSRVRLPPPKLDQCGLGFEPYKDAPEFQRYREKRKQHARDRASYNSRDNVYRISDVAADMEGNGNSSIADRQNSSQHPHESNSGEYLSYETAEDFVGKRSAAGFALRDDEDNVYDDDITYNHRNQSEKNGGKQSIPSKGVNVGDEYNTEVYEHESSDEDIGVNKNTQSTVSGKKNQKGSMDIGNMFAAWAGTDQASRSAKSSSVQRAALTSDGRPPLAGFILGDSMDINKRRYTGPNMPRDYTIQRHKFGEHENPFVLEAISNAVRLEQKEERRSQMREQQDSQRFIQQKRHESSSRPLSNNFSTLAEAMKSRFTSSTEDATKKGESNTENSKSLPAGLHMPRPVEDKKVRSNNANLPMLKLDKSKVTISRSTGSFFPNPLVCKRFHVPIPNNARRNSNLISADDTKNNESVYFEKEILGKAKEQLLNEKQMAQKVEARTQMSESQEEIETSKGINRPSIENLRKVFEASSDESSSSEDDSTIEELKNGDDQSPKESSGTAKDDKSHPGISVDDPPSQEMVEYRPSSSRNHEVDNISSSPSGSDSDDDRARSKRRKKSKHRRKRSHHRKRHKRKRSRSDDSDYDSHYSDGSSYDEKEGRRDERRSREHKKRKKKKSSSRHHKSRKSDKSEKR